MVAMNKISQICTVLLLIASVVCGLASCKKKSIPAEEYMKSIVEDAKTLNNKCPIAQHNGAEVVAVECKDGQLVFTCKVSDQVISSINLDEASQQIVSSVSDKMKVKLIKGNCDLVYKYVSENDSSSITINPDVLADAYKKDHPEKK